MWEDFQSKWAKQTADKKNFEKRHKWSFIRRNKQEKIEKEYTT